MAVVTTRDKMTVTLSRDEALVLFEWLARFNQTSDATFADQAEQRVLWNLEAVLEKTLAEPFAGDYDKLLAEARARLRDSSS
jgi:hypothetical protein